MTQSTHCQLLLSALHDLDRLQSRGTRKGGDCGTLHITGSVNIHVGLLTICSIAETDHQFGSCYFKVLSKQLF